MHVAVASNFLPILGPLPFVFARPERLRNAACIEAGENARTHTERRHKFLNESARQSRNYRDTYGVNPFKCFSYCCSLLWRFLCLFLFTLIGCPAKQQKTIAKINSEKFFSYCSNNIWWTAMFVFLWSLRKSHCLNFRHFLSTHSERIISVEKWNASDKGKKEENTRKCEWRDRERERERGGENKTAFSFVWF